MAEAERDWRVLDGVTTAWFAAGSLREGAALAARVREEAPDAVVDVRPAGVRVRLAAGGPTEAVSSAAQVLGLSADPAALQQLGVVIESVAPGTLRPFWQQVLGYEPETDEAADGAADALADPLRRDPTVRLRRTAGARPLRNRVHVDVVRPAPVVARVAPGEPAGPYGVCHRDADGNEVDLVPGDPLGEGPATADWQSVFSAVACYRTTSEAQQRDLVDTAAALADAHGFPLLVDVRPGLVVLDSGKDRWDGDAHGLPLQFTDLAAALQSAARDLGARADADLPRFVQLFLDAADVEAVRGFWAAALGYDRDRRAGLTDLVDPRWLNPVLVLQPLDTGEVERRRQRNRVHLELAVPHDSAPARVATAVAAGGRLLEESAGRWRLADPEGNELVVLGGT